MSNIHGTGGNPLKRAMVAIVLGLVAGLFFSTGAAYADDALTVSESADGGAALATCTVTTDLSSISCDLTDNKADKHPVFIQWWRDGDENRFENGDGATHTRHYEESGLATKKSLSWRVCVDKQFQGDPCSRTVDHTPGPGGTPMEVYCADINTQNPPSASIPPDLQPAFNCYPTGDNTNGLSQDCAKALAEATLGVYVEGRAWKQAGEIVWRKTPAGWVLVGFGIDDMVRDCI